MVWVGRRGLRDRLPLQSWAGMRTKTTMANDETWRAAHRASGGATVVGGLLMALGGLAVIVLHPGEETAVAVLMGTLAATGVAVTVGAVRAQRAAREVLSSADGG